MCQWRDDKEGVQSIIQEVRPKYSQKYPECHYGLYLGPAEIKIIWQQ